MRRSSLVGCLVLLCLASRLYAHSIHQSTAEAEYNPQTKKLEVSLTVFVNDLELALMRHCEREMRLNRTPAAEFDAQIQSYLAKTFVVIDSTGEPTKIEWAGRATDPANVQSADPKLTIFFALPLAGGFTKTKLRHSVFCELFNDQMNLVRVRGDVQNPELRFVRDDAPKALGRAEGAP